MQTRVLVTDVYVAGQRFLAGTTPPEQYARRITNPAAWGYVVEEEVTKVIAQPQPGNTEPPQPRPGPTPPEQPESGGAGARLSQEPHDPPTVVVDGDQGKPALLKAPPRSGKGSGIDAWEAYAAVHGVHPHPGAERAEIIAACEQAGLIDPA
jgi:hypothetical protein